MFSHWLCASLARRKWTRNQLRRKVAELGGDLSEADLAGLCSAAGHDLDAALVILLARALDESPGEALIAAGARDPSFHVQRLDRPLLVGVTGGTGAGKSFVATWIAGLLGSALAERVEMDWYYQAAAPNSSPADREARNYDRPEAYELDRFIQDLAALRRGSAIAAPQYDFICHDRARTSLPVKPAPVIVVEGIFLFQDPRVRDLLDLKLFVEAADDTRFQRRLQRDQLHRGRSAEEVHKRFHEDAQPAHENYVGPTRRYADLILVNSRADLQLPRGLEPVLGWILQRCMR